MLSALIYLTALSCLGFAALAYFRYQDIFHPLILVTPMCAFIYVYMPLKFIRNGELSAYLTDEQCIFTQTIVLLALTAWFLGCYFGSEHIVPVSRSYSMGPVDVATLHKGAYVLGIIGFACWYFTIRAAGGVSRAFGYGGGMGWSSVGYIREAVYLLIVAVLMLLSPEGFRFPQRKWTLAVITFSIPWVMQALLGARRGPTFVITVALGMSWFLARKTRPSPLLMMTSGLCLGFLMLFLVANRGSIYIGSDFQNISTNVTEKTTEASEGNEYIFGAGTMVSARATGKYYWGKRYLAQIFVRPIPRQIWENKYADVGLEDLEKNGGVAGEGIKSETNWEEIPGAAAAMVADFFVEFSYLCIPFCALVGYWYGYTWRRAVRDGRFWTTQYVILCMLSIYMVTQSGEAVIFRLVILSIPSLYIWRKAIAKGRLMTPAAIAAQAQAAAVSHV